MDVLKVTKSISFDRIKDVTRFNDIDVSFLYVDKNKSFFYQKKKNKKTCKTLKWIEIFTTKIYYRKANYCTYLAFAHPDRKNSLLLVDWRTKKIICNRVVNVLRVS